MYDSEQSFDYLPEYERYENAEQDFIQEYPKKPRTQIKYRLKTFNDDDQDSEASADEIQDS